MSDLAVKARLDADGTRLVDQLSKAEIAARGLEGALEETAGGARQLDSATDGVAASATKAAGGARVHSAALKEEVAAARGAAQGNQQLAQSHELAQQAGMRNTTSLAAQRAGYQQLGFQMQDVFMQASLGINPLVILAQQGGQTASAIALMGGAATGAQAKFVRFATFLSGPYGAAVFGAVTVIGLMVQSLLNAEEASDLAAAGADGLSEAQSALGKIFDETSGRINSQNELLILNARLTAVNLRAEALAQKESARSAFGNFDRGKLGLSTGQKVLGAFGVPVYGATSRDMQVRGLLGQVRNGELTREQALQRSEKLDFSGLAISRGDFQQALVDQVSADLKEQTAGLIDQSLDSGVLAQELRQPGRGKNKGRGRKKVDTSVRDAERLADFGESSDEKIQRMLSSYDPAPRGIDKALTDLRQIDALMVELGKRKPPGFAETIASAERAKAAIQVGIVEQIAEISDRFSDIPRGMTDAQAAMTDIAAIGNALREASPPNLDILLGQLDEAKSAVEESLNRPFRQMREESERRQQVDLLILAGREAEARTLEEIWRLERDLGPLSAERRKEVEGIVLAEEEHLDRLEKAQELQSAYLGTTRSVRGELEAIFAGKGDLSNFKRIFSDLKARVMVEQIFGPALDAFDDYVKQETAIDEAVTDFADETHRAGDAAGSLADSLTDAATRIANPGAGGAAHGWAADFDATFPGGSNASADTDPEGEVGETIVVTGSRDVSEGIEKSNSVMGMTPERYFEQMTKRMVSPVLDQLDGLFGVEFFGKMQGAISGYLYGSATGGKVGGLLGLGKGLMDDFGADLFGEKLAGSLSGILGKGLAGAQSGTMVAGLGNMLGINMSGNGAQLGGALGSFLPIPGGAIIGSIAGGLLGGLFKKKPYGTAVLGSGSLSTSGQQGDVAGGLGGSVQETLDQIVEELGGQLGAYRVSIGTYNDSFRVSTTGQSGRLSGRTNDEGRNEREQGLYRFTDEAEALAFAIADAIGDGAVQGISEKMQRALRSSPDIDKAVEEALKVRNIEELLSGLADDYSEELRAFERVAAERLRIGRDYGFDIVELERVNAEERAAIVDDILQSRVGSLKELLEDLTFGDLAEGTLSERRQRLLGEIANAEQAASDGEDGAADRLANLNRQLIELSRSAYGTAGAEYGSDRDRAISSAERIIQMEEDRLRESQAEVTNRLDEGNRLTSETNDMLAEISAGIARLGLAPSGSGLAIEPIREAVRTVSLR